MKRGEVTTVSQLSPGDRFYKRLAKDGKRYELIEKCKALPDGNKWIEEMKGSTSVVFLRNVNDK